MTNMQHLMKQAQQMQKKMQEQMEAMETKLKAMEIEGQAGGGIVKTLVDGKSRLLSIKIDKSLVADDIDMMEDLIVAAVNDAREKAEKMTAEETAKITGGLNLPGGLSF